MKKLFLFGLLILTLLTVSCSNVVADKPPQVELNLDSLKDEPLKISICDLADNPQNFNHKLIEVTGFISHGFEDFSISDPSCSKTQEIWLEYGGTNNSGTMYCCGVTAKRSRPEKLEVENIPISLTVDEPFQQFDKLIQQEYDTTIHATLIGRFFSGKKLEYPNATVWGGYGHMGCCALLAIERIVSVDPHDRKDVDYGASDIIPELNKLNSYRILSPNESSKDLIMAQQKAESGERGWSFDNPLQVASDALASLTKVSEKSIIGITQIRQSQGRIVYRWKNRATGATYFVIVSRPYWLSYFAQDREKVAWVATRVYKHPY